MPDFLHALQSGQSNLWLFIPAAILLGAFHGLEPGHSKTMMAAFIVAIRGTVWQAIMLGLAAAISHSLIIWLLAAGALHFGSQWNAERIEPYLQIGSAACILGLALWMFWRTRADLRAAAHHDHSHDHDHHHHDESFLLNIGDTKLELSVFEDGVPPVFRLRNPDGKPLPEPATVSLETVRPDGSRQSFAFAAKAGFLESTEPIPEPHAFDALLKVGAESCRAEFREHAHPGSAEYEDAHQRAHAQDIAKRFAGGSATNSQILLFGITGGLMPCPAAFSVLLVCLQLKRATLGFAMVAAFSFGLALTMVLSGVIAALSIKQMQKRFSGFGDLMRRAPYVSCALLTVLALSMAWHGWHGWHGLAALQP